jgi:hypothetical protein
LAEIGYLNEAAPGWQDRLLGSVCYSLANLAFGTIGIVEA